MSCVNLIRCPTRWYLMLTLENYYANGCKRKRWRSVKLSKRYLRAPAMIERKCNPFNQTFLRKSKLQTCNEFLKFTFEVEINLSPYFITWLISLIHRSMKITYNPWLIIRLHVQTKGYYFFLLSFLLIEIPHSDWEARVVNSWKKKNARLQSHHLNAKTRCFKTQKLSLAFRSKEKTSLPFWVKRSADNSLASFLWQQYFLKQKNYWWVSNHCLLFRELRPLVRV